jgi:hypothetical protein
MKGTVLELKRELFRRIPGRYDVYSIQHTKGYTHVSAPLEQKTYLDDDLTIGCYLLDQDNMVDVGIIDIDVNKQAYTKAPISTFSEILKNQVRQIKKVLDAAGISYLTEFSGFKGYHLIIPFDQPVQASIVRKKLYELEKKFVLVDDRLHWELFPKQDKVPTGKFGNLIKLPLQKHQGSGNFSHFVDKDFNEILPDSIPINPIRVLDLEKVKEDATGNISFKGPVPHNIERMENRCGYIRDAILKIKHEKYLEHDTRVKLGAIYKNLGERGLKQFHHHFSGLEDYSRSKTNIYLDKLAGKPTTCEKMCGRNKCDAVKATNYKSPVGFACQVAAGEIFEKRGRYVLKRYNRGGEHNDKVLTEWVIKPNKMVNLGDKDVLFCDIVSTQGNTYKDHRLENDAWHSKQKLLKALGHSDLTFHGTEADVQNLAQYITSRTLTSKTGINYIGLKDDVFVARDVNITRDEINHDPEIELYIRGTESLADEYDLTKTCTDSEYLDIAEVIYKNLPNINEPETIYPLIGWISLAPIKEKIVEQVEAFPVGNVSGEAGSGKTASVESLGMLSGSVDGTVHDCRITKFALLHLVSSTNGVPIILDEYKESTMDRMTVTAIKDTLRGVYRGELTKRGHADQSVSSYKLQAPVLISGEYKIDETAIKERSIFSGFKKNSLKNKKYVAAFKRLNTVDLGFFQPRFIQYLLGVDLDKYFAGACTYFSTHETYKALNPRVQNNWQVLHVGLSIWYDYGIMLGLKPANIPFKTIFERQAVELGYNTTGYMLRDVDKLMEHVSIMAENNIIKHGVEYALVDDVIFIHPKSMLTALRRYAQSHNLDIFIMDESSFRSQLKDAEYFLTYDKKTIDGKQKRWACLDPKKMESTGLEIEGLVQKRSSLII